MVLGRPYGARAGWTAPGRGGPGHSRGTAAFAGPVGPPSTSRAAATVRGPVICGPRRERFHCLGVYTEFYRQVPVEHQMAIGLPPSGGRVIGIALSRGRGDFSEDDRDLLAVLRAPLVRATSRARSRHRAREALNGPDDSQLAGLTSRELQLLELVAMGRTNTAITRTLEISPGRLPTTSTTSTASWTFPAAPPPSTAP